MPSLPDYSTGALGELWRAGTRTWDATAGPPTCSRGTGWGTWSVYFSQGRRGGCAASHSGGTKARRAAASVRRRNRSVASDAMPTTRREAAGTKK